MQITCKFPIRVFDKAAYIRKLEENCFQFRQYLAREFLRTALSKIPVWSGAAQATLIPLAQLMQISEVIPTQPQKTTFTDEEHGIAAGIAHGSATIPSKTISGGFMFTHDLKHFVIEDSGWNAVKSAANRVQELLATHGNRVLPRMVDYFRLKQ